ncbi:autophagy-related protein 16-like isoform X1 [Silene latifolia]|uniref:autophagy-related protein 16-like isoform X1 n=1 Tax=Silene latifolia TaxID=37657 RepID=UPI003D771459
MAMIDKSKEEEIDDKARKAINDCLWQLKQRRKFEEGAFLDLINAQSRPFVDQGTEWKEKAEKLELELQQCYKAQSRLSSQLVEEVTEGRAAKASIQEKDTLIADLEKEVALLRDECSKLKALLEEKTQGVELLTSENEDLKARLEEMTVKLKAAEAENKMLIDRWMLQKMQDAERLNEVNALYKEMQDEVKARSIQQLACMQVDGVVRQSEEGAEYFSESIIPNHCKNRIRAHDSGCASILFEYNSSKLITGGQDSSIKIWDSSTGSLNQTLQGCLGSILDLTVTNDNKSIIAATSSNNLYVWDIATARIRHTLTGHSNKVCAVDVSKVSNRHVISAAYDRTIKAWDLNKGYCTNTILHPSNCNALCFNMDGRTICSGHQDGYVRQWDIETGKKLSEVEAHSQALTSISLSRNGNTILTSGRDNVHNLFDMRTLEIYGTLRASGNRIASNWSRSCISPDDNYVAAGSADGSVYIWSIQKGDIVATLKEHAAPVLCCNWSGLGKMLATSDKDGVVCVWS